MEQRSTSETNPLGIGADDCVYTACYCEENVWNMCKSLEVNCKDLLKGSFAVFISNEKRMVPIWMQRASNSPDGIVVWDYHVILICQLDQKSFVYDLDTTLPFPCLFEDYLRLSLRDDDFLCPEYHRKFRVIPGEVYLKKFASDRSHMKDEDGSWKSPPPAYPCISTEESTMNLDHFINMDSDGWLGDVVNLSELTDQFKGNT